MEQDLLIDGVLIGLQALCVVAAVPAVPGDPEVLDIDFPVSLPDQKIRGVGLAGQLDVVAVDRLIDVVDSIAVEEIGDLHLLGRPQDLIADGDLLFPLGIHDLCAVLIQLTPHGRVAHLRDSPEEGLQVVFIEGRVKIGCKKEDQAVDQTLILQDLPAKIIPDDKKLLAAVHNVDPLRVLHVEDGVARRVKGTDGAVNLQIALNAGPQLLHRLVGKGNDQDLFGLYPLSVHQISDFGRHRGRLARAGTRNDQTVVLVGQDHTPLGIVESNLRIHRVQDMVQIVLFIDQGALYPALIVVLDTGLDRRLRLRAFGTQIQDLLHLLHKAGRLDSVLTAVKLQHPFFTEYLQIAQVSSPRVDDLSISAGRDIGIFRVQFLEFSVQTDDIPQVRRQLREAAVRGLSTKSFLLIRRLEIGQLPRGGAVR